MTNEEYHVFLSTNQASIEDKILKHFSKDPQIIYNHDNCLGVMESLIEKRMTRWIESSTVHPSIEENFNPEAFFISQWLINIYPSTVKEIFTKIEKHLTTIDLDENMEDKSNMEEECMIKWIKEELVKANNEFIDRLSDYDKKVFIGMLRDQSDKEMAAILFPKSEYTIQNRDKVRYMMNIVEFRYSSFLLYKRIWDEEKILRRINKSPKLCKRFFGIEKILQVPSNADLLAAAFGDGTKKQETSKPFVRPTPFSKVDFNGKKHDHFVVYELNGSLYDHVTKETKMKEAI